MEGLPYFKFYAAEFLSDEDVLAMSFAERGLWLTLAARCWLEGSFPADMEKLARVVGAPDADALRSLYGGIEGRFAAHPSDPSRRISPRIEEERNKAIEASEARSEAGRAAANARWSKGKSSNGRDHAGAMRTHSGRNASQSQTQREIQSQTPPPGGGDDLKGFREKLALKLGVPTIDLGRDADRSLAAVRRLLDLGIPEDEVVTECAGIAQNKRVTPAHLSWWAGWLNTISTENIDRWKQASHSVRDGG